MSGGDFDIKVEGLRELEAALVQLDKAIPGILAKSLKGPMEPVLATAKSLVPTDTGALRDALDLTPVRRAAAARASMADTLSEVGLRIKKMKRADRYRKYGARGRHVINPRHYWHLVEFGTSHSAAKPYLRPAFDQHVDGMVKGFTTTAREQIERTQARFARARKRRRK